MTRRRRGTLTRRAALYNIHRWGAKYFDINDAGHVVARPLQDAGAAVDIDGRDRGGQRRAG